MLVVTCSSRLPVVAKSTYMTMSFIITKGKRTIGCYKGMKECQLDAHAKISGVNPKSSYATNSMLGGLRFVHKW